MKLPHSPLLIPGFLEVNVNAINEDNFNTNAYIVGQYEGTVKDMLPSYDPAGVGKERFQKLMVFFYLITDYLQKQNGNMQL